MKLSELICPKCKEFLSKHTDDKVVICNSWIQLKKEAEQFTVWFTDDQIEHGVYKDMIKFDGGDEDE